MCWAEYFSQQPVKKSFSTCSKLRAVTNKHLNGKNRRTTILYAVPALKGCCQNGKVELTALQRPQVVCVSTLFLGEEQMAKDFQAKIHSYNCAPNLQAVQLFLWVQLCLAVVCNTYAFKGVGTMPSAASCLTQVTVPSCCAALHF